METINTPIRLAFVQDQACNPWSNIVASPMTLYVVLVLLVLIWGGYKLFTGGFAGNARSWIYLILTVLVFLIIAVAFGKWIYMLSAQCKNGQAWGVFIFAIFFPLILLLILGVVFGTLGLILK